MVSISAMTLLLAAGCTVEPAEGQLVCVDDQDCPTGWLCDGSGAGRCYSDEDLFGNETDTIDTSDGTDSGTGDPGDTGTGIPIESCADVERTYDFESGAQGFAHNLVPPGAGDSWARGNPSLGSCNDGSSGCWATNLDGNYAKCDSAALVSPILDLSFCLTELLPVTLNFYLNYEFESPLAGGILEFSSDGGGTWQTVNPLPGYSGIINGLYTGGCGPSYVEGLNSWTGIISGGWTQATIAIDDVYKTNGFRFRFVYGSDKNSGSLVGWFIDDVSLVVN